MLSTKASTNESASKETLDPYYYSMARAEGGLQKSVRGCECRILEQDFFMSSPSNLSHLFYQLSYHKKSDRLLMGLYVTL
ncbi:unknown protein [Desulfotalea psychrophila LSv54]|uniref:Uncharacterized protein n=1 Tax=Desulfotalea psychrophila (strain LSv54 / DSM 12343) TaxID=177439 RepID=Q6AKR5_DESPS|nr:unknown protein [Desulfotalea psychrophila LSv54]